MQKFHESRMFEVRAFNEQEGTFEAYVATWDTADSFGTRFKKGAFRKTIRERMKKGNIKLLWQHKMDEPIGLVLDAREDEHGLLILGRLDVGVPRADQARQQMGSGTINQMSFGFDIIQQKKNKDDGLVDISEVRLWECSPVTFGANPETSVVNVRSMQFATAEKPNEIRLPEHGSFFSYNGEEVIQANQENLDLAMRKLQELNDEFDGGSGVHSLPDSDDTLAPGGPDSPSLLEAWGKDSRGVDFDDTFDSNEFASRGFRILDALYETVMDCLFSAEDVDVVTASDVAFEKAHAKWMDWISELTGRGMRADNPHDNILSIATKERVGDQAIDDVAKDSPLSTDELRTLLRGDILPLSARGRLADYSKEVSQAHAKRRGEIVSQLFEEIRASGFSQAEVIRLRALLDRDLSDLSVEPGGEDHSALLDAVRQINKEFQIN